MTVYYFEGSPIVAPFTIESKEVVLASESFSLRQTRRATDAQRWDLTFNVMPTKGESEVFLNMLTNSRSVNSMVMPQLTSVDKSITVTNDLVVNSQASLGNSIINVSSVNTGAVLPLGTFIQFSDHTKIYTIVATEYVDSNFNIEIFPTLRKNVANGVTIRHANSSVKPQYSYYRSLDSISGITFSDGVISDPGTIKLTEVV